MDADRINIKIGTSSENSARGFFVASGEQPLPKAVSIHSLPEAFVFKRSLRKRIADKKYRETHINKDQLEHKIPLSRGGSDKRENLDISCKECNMNKGIKTTQEFLEAIQLGKK